MPDMHYGTCWIDSKLYTKFLATSELLLKGFLLNNSGDSFCKKFVYVLHSDKKLVFGIVSGFLRESITIYF